MQVPRGDHSITKREVCPWDHQVRPWFPKLMSRELGQASSEGCSGLRAEDVTSDRGPTTAPSGPHFPIILQNFGDEITVEMPLRVTTLRKEPCPHQVMSFKSNIRSQRGKELSAMDPP